MKCQRALFPWLLLQTLAACDAKGASSAGGALQALASTRRHLRPAEPSTSVAFASSATATDAEQSTSLPSTYHDDDSVLFRQAAAVGIVTAAMGHVCGNILDRTVRGLWKDLPNLLIRRGKLNEATGPRYIPCAMAVGGIVMGLLSIGLKPTYVVADFVAALSGGDASRMPRLMPALPNLLLLSLVTSTFGFSVGPEAPMVCAGGLVGVAMARRWYHREEGGDDSCPEGERILAYAGSAGALTAFMGVPLAGSIFALELTRPSAGMSPAAKEALVPSVVSSVAALALIRGILTPRSSVGGHFSFGPASGLNGRSAIVIALLCGMGGAVLGTAFHKLVHSLKDLFWYDDKSSIKISAGEDIVGLLKNRELLVKASVGLGVGLLSTKFPSTMFWGEGSLQIAIDAQSTPFADTKHGLPTLLTGSAIVNPNAPYESAWAGLQVGLAKLISIALACAGKFPGGIIFPLFFAAAPIANAVLEALSPYLKGSLANPVAVMSLMAATQSSVTRTPFATVLMLTLSCSSATHVSAMLPSVILSSYIGVWFSRFLSKESYFGYSE